MKTGGFILLALLLVGLCVAERTTQTRRQSENQQQLKSKPFQSGNEYTFEYNAQMSSGLMVGQENVDSQQTAATRIQSEAQITFQSESEGILRLRNIKIGYLNEQLDRPEQVQPMGRFELKTIQNEKKTQLQLPVQFKYADGVVENVQFHADDSSWSKNIKRSVLNLVQLNLNKNNAQGLRNQETEGSSEEEQTEGQQLRYRAFTIPETTIEGECQTTYTITKVQERRNQIDGEEQDSQRKQYQRFNVTKSIDFKQCNKVADIGFGFQTQQLQPKWWQCQKQWEQMQKQEKSGRQQLSAPCDQYDPKEINDQQLDRSTVLRFELSGKPQKYAIQRVELLSHYVFKNLHSENSQHASAMQTFVAAELVFVQSKQAQRQESVRSSETVESLLYSNEWDVEEKRFYMLGDEEFGRNSPFRAALNKAEQAQQILRKLIQATTDKSNGIEAENTIQLQRLVELLRMCSVEELQKIYQQLTSSVSSRNEVEQQRAEHLLADTLAIAGTRNTIFVLVDKVLTNKLTSEKAVQAMKNLNQLPAPSQQQADLVLRLCKSENAHRSPALKQSCWLAFGSMVSELCQQQRSYNGQQQQTFGFLSGFETEEICPLTKKENYKQALVKLYEEAETTSEKVLALRAIGNAGLEILVNPLEKIIQKEQEQPITRIVAIDSLRRLRHQIPQKIQSILLPLFQNVQENEKVRMAAFTMIMHTVPEQNVLDQITFTLMNEESDDVKSFVYTTMQSLSESKMPNQQKLGQHLKNSLKMANFEQQTLSGSRRYQMPIFNDEQREGALIDLISVFTDRDMFPAHLSASLHTLLNNRFEMNALRVSISQQELDRWYEQIMRQIYNLGGSSNTESYKTRGERKSTTSARGTDEITRIYKALGIKKRGGYSDLKSQKQQRGGRIEEFGVLNVRIGDVDQVIWPITKENMPQPIQNILNGGKPGLKQIVNAMSEPMHIRFVMALNLDKKSAMIPTSMGVALKIVHAAPILVTFEGHLKPTVESNGIKAQITANPSICVTQMQKMESWMPFVNTGVESYRGLEANFATHMDLVASKQDGINLVIKTPQAPKTTVFGLHSLPTTFSRDYDNKNNMHREPKVKAIHHFHLEELQRDINMKIGEQTMGMPFRIHGHYHSAADKMDYQQLMQLAMATENHVHVTFEPTKETPREFVIRLSAGAFQKVQRDNAAHAPELENFYSNAGNFETAYPEDFQDMEIDSHKERSESLKSYIANYQRSAGQMYKHHLKASAQSVGGKKDFKAQLEVETTCDSKFKFCKLNTQVKRSQMYDDENSEWMLKSKIQIVTPEIMSTLEELKQTNKNKKFVCLVETSWGTTGNQRQNINLRIQGESAHKTQWSQEIAQYTSQAQRQSEQKRMAFLNKYDVVADYKIQSSTQNFMNGVLELAKGYNFWNTKSQQRDNGRDGQFVGTIVLDPFTQRHANITVKTPTQKIRMQSVQLPIALRPFALVSRQSEKSIHSISQAINRMSTQSRAECKVDGKRVETFDEILYKAPISNCYSVLAKDCTNEEPKFIVLMKKINKNSQDKKIRIVTPDHIVECQPKNSGSEKKIHCQVDGETIEKSYGSEFDDVVDFANEEQDEVTINVEGVSVQFRCEYDDCESQKAIIKISSLYKNGQCGLCGHYDDNTDNEWRMNNDEETDNLMTFHKSYSLQDEECTQDDQDEFYSSKNEQQFSVEDSMEQQQQQDNEQQESTSANGNNEWDRESSSEEEEKWGQRKSRQQKQNRMSSRGRNYKREQENSEDAEPIMQTKVLEQNHRICFSAEPVKQCPEGTVPSSSLSNNNDDIEQDSQDNSEKIKMSFVCLNRSSVETRKLQQQARRGVVVDLQNKAPSFVESITQPQRCVRAY